MGKNKEINKELEEHIIKLYDLLDDIFYVEMGQNVSFEQLQLKLNVLLPMKDQVENYIVRGRYNKYSDPRRTAGAR